MSYYNVFSQVKRVKKPEMSLNGLKRGELLACLRTPRYYVYCENQNCRAISNQVVQV